MLFPRCTLAVAGLLLAALLTATPADAQVSDLPPWAKGSILLKASGASSFEPARPSTLPLETASFEPSCTLKVVGFLVGTVLENFAIHRSTFNYSNLTYAERVPYRTLPPLQYEPPVPLPPAPYDLPPFPPLPDR